MKRAILPGRVRGRMTEWKNKDREIGILGFTMLLAGCVIWYEPFKLS